MKLSILFPEELRKDLQHRHIDASESYQKAFHHAVRKFINEGSLPTPLYEGKWGARNKTFKLSVTVDEGLAAKLKHVATECGLNSNALYVNLIAAEYGLDLGQYPEFYRPLTEAKSLPELAHPQGSLPSENGATSSSAPLVGIFGAKEWRTIVGEQKDSSAIVRAAEREEREERKRFNDAWKR